MSAITRRIPELDDAAQFTAAYRVIWRWHFYAGLFCLPFIVVLCLSGAVFLFKPQINAFLDRPYDHLALRGEAKSLDEQVAAAQATMPDARLISIELRDDPTDAARVHLMTGDPAKGEFELYRVLVRPDTLEILKKEAENWTPVEIARNIHGELLLGTPGNIAVELAGAWAIVMVVTGLYLWWPRDGRGAAGVFYRGCRRTAACSGAICTPSPAFGCRSLRCSSCSLRCHGPRFGAEDLGICEASASSNWCNRTGPPAPPTRRRRPRRVSRRRPPRPPKTRTRSIADSGAR